MRYVFKYRRRYFWVRETVIGHGYDPVQNKMILYFPSGAVREIAEWSKCEVALGTDWVLATKKSIEQKAGQPIALAVEA